MIKSARFYRYIFRPEKYEKDIRDIVEYFERKKEKKISASGDEADTRSSMESDKNNV